MFTICRFTPPTCSLEIKGKKSHWFYGKNHKIANEFEFELKFDDPRQPNCEGITVRGDRQELKQLEIAVESYLTTYLARSFLPTVEQSESEQSQNQQKMPEFSSKGANDHELWLDFLNRDRKSQKITLSTVQLFDLVTALAAFDRSQATRSKKLNKKILVWGGIVTLAIAAVGTIAVVSRTSVQQPTAISDPVTPPQAPKSDRIVPPETPPEIEQPELNSVNEPLTSAQRLPPPPAVDTPKPKPDIPDPADYPLPEDVLRRSQLDEPKSPTAGEPTKSTIAIAPQKNSELSAIAPNTNSTDTITDNLSKDKTSNLPKPPDRVRQVVAYFQENWQPPADLNQSLEYRLAIDADGAIARVTPLGKASSLYLSQTNIPLNGEPFIEPLAESGSATIRLLLNPNGKVQAFIEK